LKTKQKRFAEAMVVVLPRVTYCRRGKILGAHMSCANLSVRECAQAKGEGTRGRGNVPVFKENSRGESLDGRGVVSGVRLGVIRGPSLKERKVTAHGKGIWGSWRVHGKENIDRT